MTSSTTDNRDALRTRLQRAGYYPELVLDIVEGAVVGEAISESLVHVETTFAANYGSSVHLRREKSRITYS